VSAVLVSAFPLANYAGETRDTLKQNQIWHCQIHLTKRKYIMSLSQVAPSDVAFKTVLPDLAALKTRQQGMWSAGDYAIVGTTIQIVGETLCEAMDLRAGSKVLDVAAGNGNATLAAARRWCDVTSTDYVPALLDRGKARAKAEGLSVSFQPADAEDLPFKDASFDAVLSTFGVMFTPDQEKSSAELLRVCKKGGKIGLANWTPEGFIGQIFKTIGSHIPPVQGVKSPVLWGTEDRLADLFGSAGKASITQQTFTFRYKSAAHWIEVFRTWYGPMNKAFAALPDPQKTVLENDLTTVINRFNRAKDGTAVIPSTYLEVVITKN
jgi:ubiquinone/menaquinone biosynthesis C-methylase UbiE